MTMTSRIIHVKKTLITFKCVECLNTHPDEFSAKICCDNNLEGKTMPRSDGAPKTTKRKPAAKKKPVGFVKRKTKKKTKVS